MFAVPELAVPGGGVGVAPGANAGAAVNIPRKIAYYD